MKISQKEIDTAWQHAFHSWPESSKGQVRMMLEAAYTVRRARKKAKRERQRKEKDKQVQESAGPIGVLLGIDPFCEAPDSKA